MGISGLILAGGKATRMEGANKALVPFLGRAMISHVIERLSPQVDEILINANQDVTSYQTFHLPVLADAIGDFPGPLAGLHAGLKASQHEWVLCVPCDSPLLPHHLAERLMQAVTKENADIAIAKTVVQNHPVFCLCKKSLAADLANYLHQGGRKVREWQQTHRCIEVHFDDDNTFSNINTLEDLTKLEALCIKGTAT
jgi:molybdopterin-guanine dinucleotide biosynthesis protein A